MKLNKLLFSLLATSMTIGSLTACANVSAGEITIDHSALEDKIEVEKAEQKEEKVVKEEAKKEEAIVEEEEELYDCNGMEIVLAGWGDVREPEVKTSAQQEALWEYRNDMMEKHNFTFAERGMAGWNELLELLSTSTMAGDPAAEVFRIHVNFLDTAKNSGLLYDLATLDNIDVHDEKWGKPLTEKMSVGDSVYGLSPQENPLMCIYFNKRIFEEAGLDGDLLYDLQASGDWTWEKFEEISDILTQDFDNDGINDVNAINCNTYFFTQAAIFSNGGSFIGRDENGKYFNNMSSPETIEALEWAQKYWKTDNELIPEHWDGHRALFTSGKVAMYLAGAWESGVLSKTSNMPDEWGLVAFPKGPRADDYTALYSYDAYVIPASFSKEEAEAIALGYNMWTNQPPGYDGPDDWKLRQYPYYKDDRAIDETLTMLKYSDNPQIDNSSVLSAAGIVAAAIGSDIYFDRMSISEAIESRQSHWQIELDKINGVVSDSVATEEVAE